MVHASTAGFPLTPDAALTIYGGDVRVSVMALLQQPDPRAPLHLLPSAAVAARLAGDQANSWRAAMQTAVTAYQHQRACREPLAVRVFLRALRETLQHCKAVSYAAACP